MIQYPEDLVDKGLFDRCLARLNDAQANAARLRAVATDAAGALKNAQAERDALVLRSSKEGGVHAGESLAAHRAVADAETQAGFARDALAAAEAEVSAAQRALDKASGDAHLPVLQHAIDLRVEAAAELDRCELALAEARARYADAGEIAGLANLRGARRPNQPILDRGPYGRAPGLHEAAERAVWGWPQKDPLAE